MDIKDAAQDRTERWKRKLLDLSARNRLLNMPPSSRSLLPLIPPSIADLENALAEGRTIKVASAEEALGAAAAEDLAAGRLDAAARDSALRNALSRGIVCSLLPPDAVRRRMDSLYREARTALEESGANTLYLALGSLCWTDHPPPRKALRRTGAEAKVRRAPILMVPVRLQRASMADGIRLCRIDEDTAANATLVEFLRSRLGVKVPGLDPLPYDESGVDVPAVLQAFEEAVRNREGSSYMAHGEEADQSSVALCAEEDGWCVERDATLGCFSFGKFAMWRDMADNMGAMRKHPLIDHLAGGTAATNFSSATHSEEAGQSSATLCAEEDQSSVALCAEEEAHSAKVAAYSQFCPLAWDASQLAAVIRSASGKTFVLHGPPGTGKSQTITNIIAHNLALGRRVLFVSEKKAALDVVKNRLDGIGLSPFCLELHSNKTEKRRFYAQIKEALDVPDSAAALCAEADQSSAALCAKVEACRSELDSYVEALHRKRANGLSAYECFASRTAKGPEPVELHLSSTHSTKVDRSSAAHRAKEEALAITPDEAEHLRALVADMANAWTATQPEAVAAMRPILADFEWNPAAERNAALALAALPLAIEKNGFAFVPKHPAAGGARPLSAEEMLSAAAKAESLAAKPRWLKGILSFFAGIGKHKAGMEFAAMLDAARAHVGETRGVMRFRAAERATSSRIGKAFSDALIRGDFKPDEATAAFDRSFAAKTLEEILAQDPALAGFASPRHDARVAELRRLGIASRDLARRLVFAKLAARLPRRRSGPCPAASELGMLQRECEKKSRQKAVRQMISESRTLLPILKPCFLMSPLSVAQYLPVDAPPFDLVVFDEASQIPVWDAVGVIARARQLVVVGDPEQMPPTSFFQKGYAADGEDDEDEEYIEDAESILDECLVAGVPSARLTWHYRSRHESLIAFSNAHYYGNSLCTFPAAASSPELGVRFRFVEGGAFVRQGAKGPRTNPVEAKALVDAVCAEALGTGKRRRSIGVVTFSMAQQRLVQTMLEERRAADPELEKRLPEDGEGAYFVKNLENVQGDESDVIFFSVGYAPNENGRLTMNFGPLNLSGGERRLNVAITRAREQVVVFSSIHGSQIDAGENGRTKSVGAAHLKEFLEYAERQGAVATPTGAGGGEGGGTAAPAGASTADDIAGFLKENGYEVDRDIGCSDPRIDIAVRDQRKSGAWMAGIECDGPGYARQSTAQDRDVNRASVLGSLGWRMHRVWSADWALDRARAGLHLLEWLESDGDATADKAAAERPPHQLASRPVPTTADKPGTAETTGVGEAGAPYEIWTSRARHQPTRFCEQASLAQIAREMKAIVEKEGPVCEAMIYRRICQAWGVARVTERIRRTLEACRPGDFIVTTHGAVRVYWPTGLKPARYTGYRIATEKPESKRTTEEIPPEELANALRETRRDLGECPQDVLYREVLRLFGGSTLTPKARAALDFAAALGA